MHICKLMWTETVFERLKKLFDHQLLLTMQPPPCLAEADGAVGSPKQTWGRWADGSARLRLAAFIVWGCPGSRKVFTHPPGFPRPALATPPLSWLMLCLLICGSANRSLLKPLPPHLSVSSFQLHRGQVSCSISSGVCWRWKRRAGFGAHFCLLSAAALLVYPEVCVKSLFCCRTSLCLVFLALDSSALMSSGGFRVSFHSGRPRTSFSKQKLLKIKASFRKTFLFSPDRKFLKTSWQAC